MITIISGTSRPGANSLKVATHVQALFAGRGTATAMLDLGRLPAGAFLPAAYADKPEALQAGFIDKVLAADGLYVVVPEYNGSFPGVLKHFIDLLPFPEAFDGRPVAFAGLAAGYYGGLRAVEQLQMVFAYRNAVLYNRRVFIPSVHKVLAEDGTIADAALRERLAEQAAGFLAFTGALRAQG
jgi:chromate reductase, NAD(P)H dehydrogenase (quinone)